MLPITDAQLVDLVGSLAFLAGCVGAVAWLFLRK